MTITRRLDTTLNDLQEDFKGFYQILVKGACRLKKRNAPETAG